MIETGRVLSIDGRFAAVQFERHSACGRCGACGMAADAKEVQVRALNTAGAEPGDAVRVELKSASVLGASAMAYLLPLLFLLAGVAIGYLWNPGGLFQNAEEAAALYGVAFCALSFLGLRLLNKPLAQSGRFTPRIVSVVNESSMEKEETEYGGN